MNEDPQHLQEDIQGAHQRIAAFQEEVSQVMVGQRVLCEKLLLGLIAGGHVLVEGVPGLAKTTAVKTLALAIACSFQRIQFTPDLLPADILGTQIYNPRTQEFFIKKGPLFHNIILADEINRAPAKVQSALLEAMQERQITIGEETFTLPEPFIVMATQNPIEQEGTYPLPEAQLDRFMLKLIVSYPSRDEETRIMELYARRSVHTVRAVLTPADVQRFRELVRRVYVDPKISKYIIDLVFATREPQNFKAGLERLIQFGASPRASINLNLAACCHAFLQGRTFVLPQDVKVMAPDVLRHRIVLSYEAEADGVKSDDVVRRILERVAVP